MTPHSVTLTTLALAAPMILGACTSNRELNGTTRSPGVAPAIVVLAGSELGVECPRQSLYDALRGMRGEPLGWRAYLEAGRRGGPLPVLYLNGIRNRTAEPAEPLRLLPCASVRKVEIVAGPLAVRRYGDGHEAGAILVTTESRSMHGGRLSTALLP